MLSSHGYNHSDMVICQGIKDGFSLSSVLYELVLLKDAKLMGHCGLGHIQDFCQIADTDFGFKQDEQDADSGRVCKNFEQICQIIQFFLVRHGLIYDLQKVFMDFLTFTA